MTVQVRPARTCDVGDIRRLVDAYAARGLLLDHSVVAQLALDGEWADMPKSRDAGNRQREPAAHDVGRVALRRTERHEHRTVVLVVVCAIKTAIRSAME